MAKKFKAKQPKANKIKFSEKAAGFLFEEIINTLLKRYRESTEKDTISFEEYCIKLISLSKEKRQQKGGK